MEYAEILVNLKDILEDTLIEKIKKDLFVEDHPVDYHFLGLNQKTGKLHWFCSDEIKQKVVNEALLKTKMGPPNNPFEIDIDKAGITKETFNTGKIHYSCDGKSDIRSTGREEIDKELRIHSTIYIYVEIDNFKGVTFVTVSNEENFIPYSQDDGKLFNLFQIGLRRKLEEDQEFKTHKRNYESLMREISKMEVSDGEQRAERDLKIAELFERYFKDLKFQENAKNFYRNLAMIFSILIGNYYNKYIFNMDHNIIMMNTEYEKDSKFFTNLNRNYLEPIINFKEDFEYKIIEFFRKNSIWPEYTETLSKYENILFDLPGYRSHFFHMFHVFSVGNAIYLKLIKEPANKNIFINELERQDKFINSVDISKKYKLDQKFWENCRKNTIIEELWYLICSGHDISYPIEKINRLPEEIIEKFNIKNKIRIQSDSSKLLDGSYMHLKDIIVESIIERLDFKKIEFRHIRNILNCLYVHNLFDNFDHAILSALIIMENLRITKTFRDLEIVKNLSRYLKNPAIISTIGLAISLHNFHKWKDLYSEKIEEITEDPDEVALLKEYSKKLKIKFNTFPFAFLLTLSDVLQEYHRSQDNTLTSENESEIQEDEIIKVLQKKKIMYFRDIKLERQNQITIRIKFIGRKDGEDLIRKSYIEYAREQDKKKIMEHAKGEISYENARLEITREAIRKKIEELSLFKKAFEGGKFEFIIEFEDLHKDCNELKSFKI